MPPIFVDAVPADYEVRTPLEYLTLLHNDRMKAGVGMTNELTFGMSQENKSTVLGEFAVPVPGTNSQTIKQLTAERLVEKNVKELTKVVVVLKGIEKRMKQVGKETTEQQGTTFFEAVLEEANKWLKTK